VLELLLALGLTIAGIVPASDLPDWSMTFRFEKVIPALKEGGMTDEQLDQMMADNPRRWLAGD
jgi:predicted metal-dependent phosphotriesterase family hydrolase